jgi:hypothetical protein
MNDERRQQPFPCPSANHRRPFALTRPPASFGSQRRGAAVLFVAVCLAWSAAAPVARADANGERALWTLWARHQAEVTNLNYTAVVAASRQFDSQPGSAEFLPISRGLAAWHLLKAGATDDAVRVLQVMQAPASTGTVEAAAQTMSLRWLTRLDREKVRDALKAFYVEHVAYPDTLDELRKMKKGPAAPATDRWKKPWHYQLAKFKRLAKLHDQRYELESTTLPGRSDLKQALAAPYAQRINLRPVQMTKAGDGKPAVTFETGAAPARKVVLTEGTESDGIGLVYVGDTILILTDGDCWQILQRPGGQ